MITFECKSCGASITADEKQTTAICPYCQMLQTFDPKQEIHREIMDYANRLRREMEYDRAMEMYDSMLAEDPENAEAYWCKALCRYGVAYVRDARTGRRVPTCNRLSEISIFADPDYRECLEYASADAQMLYEEEAEKIEKIRRTYYEVARNEQAYDIFISFKDTDEAGRTIDSQLSQEIYELLTEQGYRVFYSRVSLKDVVGEDYEPYIYSALHSAKVMLLVGTRKAYIEADWVKNEWSRYLKLIAKAPGERLLIPLLREMSPGELPAQLQPYEGYNLSDWRFKDSLLKKIAHICNRQSELQKSAGTSASAKKRIHIITAENYFIRAEQEIEAGNMQKAEKLASQGLDLEPENGRGYWIQLLAVTDDLQNYTADEVKVERLYNRAIRYASDTRKLQYEAGFRTYSAKYYWNLFVKSTSRIVSSREDLEEILDKGRRAIQEDPSNEQYKRELARYESEMQKRIQKKEELSRRKKDAESSSEKLGGLTKKMFQIQNQAENLWENYYFFPYLLPALVICGQIFFVTTNPYGSSYFSLTVKVFSVLMLFSFVIAAAVSLKGIPQKLFMLAGIAAGVYSFIKVKDIQSSLRIYGVLYLFLLLFTVYRFLSLIRVNGYVSRYKKISKEIQKCAHSMTDPQYMQKSVLMKYSARSLRYLNPMISDSFIKIVMSLLLSVVVLTGMIIADAAAVSFYLGWEWSDIRSVDGGMWHIVGIKNDGTIVTAGLGLNNRCEVYNWDADEIESLFGGYYYTAALKKDGSVNSTFSLPKDFKDVVKVAKGVSEVYGIRSDGTVAAAGNNTYGQLNVEEWTGIVDVVTNSGNEYAFAAGLRGDGTVAVVGSGVDGLTDAQQWSNIVQLAAGLGYLVGLRSDGTVCIAGASCEGLSEAGGITAVTANRDIGLLSGDGSLSIYGVYDDASAYEGDAMENLSTVYAGYGYFAGIRTDGTVAVVAAPEIRVADFDKEDWSNIKELYCGMENLFALTQDGHVYSAGGGGNMCNFVGGITVTEILQDWVGRVF